MSAARKFQWAKMDVAFAGNPKVLHMLANHEQGRTAGFAYICAIGYSREHGLDGLVPREALPYVHADEELAKILSVEGFWEPCPQGWIIHDWDDWYEPAAVDEEDRERQEKARKLSETRRNAANQRWHPAGK